MCNVLNHAVNTIFINHRLSIDMLRHVIHVISMAIFTSGRDGDDDDDKIWLFAINTFGTYL